MSTGTYAYKSVSRFSDGIAFTYNFANTPFNAAKAPLVIARMIQGDVEGWGFGGGDGVDIAAAWPVIIFPVVLGC
jgi:hypothetical protein